tara:strand:+ start:156 stop:572 length:417 start_codon:yes stop_codon:yes gene_type:complete
MKKLRGYIFSRKFFGERVPQHIQNQIIRNYCKINKMEYLLSATEYAISGSSLMLSKIIREIKEIDGIVFYSLFQLPDKKIKRMKIYKKIIKLKKELHFVVEDIKMNNKQDINDIENILNIKENLPYCLNKLSYEKNYN